MPAIVVLTTVPSKAAAKKMADALVGSRVAACVSYREGFVSHYRWKGKIVRERETLLVIKSHSHKYSKLEALMKSSHPYEVPEIVCLEVKEIATPYFNWLKEALK